MTMDYWLAVLASLILWGVLGGVVLYARTEVSHRIGQRRGERGQ